MTTTIRSRRRTISIVTIAAAMTGTALALLAGAGAAPATLGPAALIALYVLAETASTRIGTGRAHAITVTELPLVAGLLFASVPTLVAARLIGSLTGSIIERRGTLKTTYNLAIHALEVTVAIRIYAAAHTDLGRFPAAIAGALAATLIGIAAVRVAIALQEGRATLTDSFRAATTSTIVTLATSVTAAAVCTSGVHSLVAVIILGALAAIAVALTHRNKPHGA